MHVYYLVTVWSAAGCLGQAGIIWRYPMLSLFVSRRLFVNLNRLQMLYLFIVGLAFLSLFRSVVLRSIRHPKRKQWPCSPCRGRWPLQVGLTLNDCRWRAACWCQPLFTLPLIQKLLRHENNCKNNCNHIHLDIHILHLCFHFSTNEIYAAGRFSPANKTF